MRKRAKADWIELSVDGDAGSSRQLQLLACPLAAPGLLSGLLTEASWSHSDAPLNELAAQLGAASVNVCPEGTEQLNEAVRGQILSPSQSSLA